jgi:hypothetical protein
VWMRVTRPLIAAVARNSPVIAPMAGSKMAA